METLSLVLLFIVTFFATSISSVTGGAGLVVTPFLILLGVNPVTAVSSYRVGTSGSVLSGWIKFHNYGKIDYETSIPLTVFSIIGAWAGVRIVLSLPSGLLKNIVSIFILSILVLLLLDPEAGVKHKKQSALKRTAGAVLSFIISLVNIVIGGGGGTLYSYLLIFFYGQTFLESAGTRKIVNGAPILFSAVLFLISGVIDPAVTATILTANLLAGWYGSEFFLKRGEGIAKKVFISATFAMAVLIFFI